ncbi:hypothetical protein FDECE_620 [Fusarium decemcellulare]|nr:hypothetical protein FDECE_620 [Fusarium decemcellulare]
MKFTYHHLARDSSEIRLVRLLEPLHQDSPLSLELCHASMNDINYTALSYVWGDVSSTVDIIVNDLLLGIGRNLHAALKQLQENNFRGWIWIDSLCIQQSDIEEKSYQVSHMGTIFGKADHVFSWLGPGTKETDRALDFVSRVGPRALDLGPLDLYERDDVSDYIAAKTEFTACLQSLPSHGDGESKWLELARFTLGLLHEPGLQSGARDDEDLIVGINELLARDYWYRIWINQEVALAKKVIILCGTKILPLDELAATFKSLEACINGYSHLRPDTRGFGKHWDIFSFYCLPLDVRDQCVRGRGSPLANILYRGIGPSGRPSFLATEPRDIVFGLLGVISDRDSVDLQPDYSMTVAEIFTAVTKSFLDREYQSCSSYNLASMVPRNEPDNPHKLPSWVPDWQKVGQENMDNQRINTGWFFNATPYTMMQPRPLISRGDNLRVLRQRGYCVDVVTEVMAAPQEPQKDGTGASGGETAKSWLSAILEFTHLGSEPSAGEDYIWRTLLVTRWRGIFRAPITEGSNGTDRPYMNEGSKAMVREFMRRRHVDAEHLTPEQVDFVKRLRSPLHTSPDLDILPNLVRYAGKRLQEQKIHLLRNRTVFKTAKGMFGLGYRVIQPGDVVTLLWGIGSPVILRRRSDSDGGGFTYLGDAYVDGIMDGEFLQTDPAPEDFFIH